MLFYSHVVINVLKACQAMELSHDTFDSNMTAVEGGDVAALLGRIRRKSNLANRVDSTDENAGQHLNAPFS